MNFIICICFSIYGYVTADTLIWSDEFNGSSGQAPDSSKWKSDTGGDGWGNQELEYHTNSATNAALDGKGNLVITARRENPANYNCWYGRCQYTSARLNTAGKFEQKYGAFEARIKLPTGKGIWPAFWLLGNNIGTAPWPQCGEIDIMENVDPLNVHGTLHGPGYSGGNGLTSSYKLPNNQPFANDFHIYRADWTTNSITFSVDGTSYATKTTADTRGNKWVFDHPFFIILNLAVGGGWPGSPDQSTVFPQSMIVDYVRVYTKDGGGPVTPGSGGQIKGIGGRCLDVIGGSSANGTPVQIFDCNGTPSQKWTIGSDGTIKALGKCLDAAGAGTANGTPVQIVDCNGSGAQKWGISPAGDIVNINANKCMDVKQPATQNGSRLQIWDCAGTSNQKWTRS